MTRGTDVVLPMALAVLALALAVFGMYLGDVPIDIGAAMFDWLDGGPMAPATAILVELRLPRAVLGLLAGATLGLAGAALQGLTRNPLAEPGIIGASGGAALGAVVCLYFGIAGLSIVALPVGGIVGALLAVVVLLLLAGGRAETTTLLLAGIAVTSLTGALTSLALNLAPSPYAAYEITFWLMGSLTDRSLQHVALVAPFVVVGCGMLLRHGMALDALTLGDARAQTLGIAVRRVRFELVLGVALSVGAVTAAIGAVGFVGLVVPHLLRPWLRHRPSRLLGASALGGAALLTAADLVVRLVARFGPELKLGVVTALVGAPFFVWLLLSRRRA
jgi:iron complex transport system permease protein